MFFNKKTVAPVVPPRRVIGSDVTKEAARGTNASVPTVSTIVETPEVQPRPKQSSGRVVDIGTLAGIGDEEYNTKEFAGLRFLNEEIETTQGLSRIVFHQVINEKIDLGQHLYARVAVALMNAGSKECIMVVDRSKITEGDISAVVELLNKKGYELSKRSPQGYYAISSLVISLSQGNLNAGNLAIQREIARDAGKSSLMTSFRDIVSWAYGKKADDIDFAVDITSDKSQICFKIGGKYIRPERYLLPTDTLIQMLGIAYQMTQGGSSAQFEIKSEQQAKLNLDLPKSLDNPEGARVRLRWSGMATDKGTVVTMRIQRLGNSASIRSLKQAGYLDSELAIVERVVDSGGGLIALAGEVGAGKSTSIVQMLKLVPPHKKIMTLEDPVELELLLAYQKTITIEISKGSNDESFRSATQALFRSAFDVLYLGEIRDGQTGSVARQVTESGHSVFTTTHSRSALGCFDRLTSPTIGIPRDVLATPDIVKLFVYQALLPKNCPHCARTPDAHAKALNLKGQLAMAHDAYFGRLYSLFGIEAESFRLRNKDGCEHCIDSDLPELSGYDGRTVVSEMIEPDERMLEYVLEGNNIKLQRYWRSLGSQGFSDDNLQGKNTMECAVYKASLGMIDPREIEPKFMRFETYETKRAFAEESNRASMRGVKGGY